MPPTFSLGVLVKVLGLPNHFWLSIFLPNLLLPNLLLERGRWHQSVSPFYKQGGPANPKATRFTARFFLSCTRRFRWKMHTSNTPKSGCLRQQGIWYLSHVKHLNIIALGRAVPFSRRPWLKLNSPQQKTHDMLRTRRPACKQFSMFFQPARQTRSSPLERPQQVLCSVLTSL